MDAKLKALACISSEEFAELLKHCFAVKLQKLEPEPFLQKEKTRIKPSIREGIN